MNNERKDLIKNTVIIALIIMLGFVIFLLNTGQPQVVEVPVIRYVNTTVYVENQTKCDLVDENVTKIQPPTKILTPVATATPVVTPTFWDDSRKQPQGFPNEDMPCCNNGTKKVCEFPWWCP